MPKFTAFARRRCSALTISGGTPNTCEAVSSKVSTNRWVLNILKIGHHLPEIFRNLGISRRRVSEDAGKPSAKVGDINIRTCSVFFGISFNQTRHRSKDEHTSKPLAKLHQRSGNNNAFNDALRDFATTFETEAQLRETEGDHLVAAHFLTQAIQAHRRVPNNKDHVEALRPRLQRLERASVAQFKRIAGEPVNTAEFARTAREHVSGKEFRDAILRLAYIAPLAEPNQMRATAIRIAKQFPLQHLFATAIVDSEGRRVGIAPAGKADAAEDDEAIFAQIVEQMGLQRRFTVQAYIIPALDQVVLEHVVTLDELKALCTYSPFVPQGRERIFAEGLYAGFNRDFLVAVHLLVPQIENSLRHLMQAQGMITTKLDNFGIQRHLNLGELVLDKRLEGIISKNVLLELRTLFVDNRGPNLRHKLAHGLLGDDTFFTVEAVYAWWLILALCIFGKVVKADLTTSAQGQPG